MTHGYVDSHIIDQALRLRLKDETSVILSDSLSANLAVH